MSDTERYEKARTKVKARFDFYTHLGVYVVIITFLALLNFILSPGRYWVIWPMVFWGLAVVLHGVSALLTSRKEELIESQIQKELSIKRFGR